MYISKIKKISNGAVSFVTPLTHLLRKIYACTEPERVHVCVCISMYTQLAEYGSIYTLSEEYNISSSSDCVKPVWGVLSCS